MAHTILLADDSNTIRTLVCKILINAGYEVLVADDGAKAVELVRQQCPDLAVLDVLMPELDGYGVCEQFKQMGGPWAELPILFLTCVKSRALELLGQEYGAYLSKPVDENELLAAIAQHLPESIHAN